jgi:hypothetical protein
MANALPPAVKRCGKRRVLESHELGSDLESRKAFPSGSLSGNTEGWTNTNSVRWNAAWSVSTILTGLLSFMLTDEYVSTTPSPFSALYFLLVLPSSLLCPATLACPVDPSALRSER